MENQNNRWKIWGIVAFVVIGFLLILLVGSYNAVMQLEEINEEKSSWNFTGNYYNAVMQLEEINEEKIENSQPEELALLDVKLYDWGYNLYDDSELLFDYWIMNYGDDEAKEVQVKCVTLDKYGNERFSGTDYYGNVASTSVGFGEFTPKKQQSFDMNEEYVVHCYIESCENCEILYKRIPDLIESYEW